MVCCFFDPPSSAGGLYPHAHPHPQAPLPIAGALRRYGRRREDIRASNFHSPLHSSRCTHNSDRSTSVLIPPLDNNFYLVDVSRYMTTIAIALVHC